MKFDKDLIKTLDYLYFLAKRIQHGQERGERTSLRKGQSVEFADYRPYAAGDEVRTVDWNVYARHDQLFVREYNATEALHIMILLDSSSSMDFPASDGGATKFETAKKLCAALAYIGLASYDTTSVYHFRDELIPVRTFVRGRAMILPMLEELDRLTPSGRTRLDQVFRSELPRLKGGTQLVVVSDFYDFEGTQETLSRVKAQFDRIHLIHVESREEYAPAVGRFMMSDPETGRTLDLSVSRRAADQYRKALEQYVQDLQTFCKRTGIHYASGFHTDPLEDWIVRIVTAGGMLRMK